VSSDVTLYFPLSHLNRVVFLHGVLSYFYKFQELFSCFFCYRGQCLKKTQWLGFENYIYDKFCRKRLVVIRNIHLLILHNDLNICLLVPVRQSTRKYKVTSEDTTNTVAYSTAPCGKRRIIWCWINQPVTFCGPGRIWGRLSENCWLSRNKCRHGL